MSCWTLKNGEVEKTLADWGVCDDFERQTNNKGKATVTLRTVEPFDPTGGTQWSALPTTPVNVPAPALIYRDRVQADDGTFSGGTVWAQGYFDDPVRQNQGGEQHVTYKLHNVWWLLEQHAYQQPRRVITGMTQSGPTATPVTTYSNVFTPEVFLGEELIAGELNTYTTGMQTNGLEIVEILNWVNECFNASRRGALGAVEGSPNVAYDPLAGDVLQIGTIQPQVCFGVKRMASITCAEAVLECLRLQPDAVVAVDETTEPPTVNVLTYATWNYSGGLLVPPAFVDYLNLPNVSVPITTTQEKTISAQGQTWKAPPAVILWWWGYNTLTVDGNPQSIPWQYFDSYGPLPGGGFGAYTFEQITAALYTPRANVHFTCLEGWSETVESAQLTVEALGLLTAGTEPIPSGSGYGSAAAAWWARNDRSLQDAKIDPATIQMQGAPVVIDDSTGEALNAGTYPNILVDSQLPKWAWALGLSWKKATIRQDAKFTRYTDTTFKLFDTKPTFRTIHKHVKVTNASAGKIQTVTSATPGEAIPYGAAISIYKSLQAPQYEGTIELTGAAIRSDLRIGCRLTLVGSNTTFAVLPQQTVERPCQGSIQVSYGPAAPATVDIMLDILRATRFRTTWRLPSGRDTGQDAGPRMDMSADAPTDDTLHSPGGFETHGVTGAVSDSAPW